MNNKKDSPSFHRNIEPLLANFHELLPNKPCHVLEIGSGSGQHVARFADAFPHLTFQPTEYDVENLGSINAWADGRSNILPALQLDVTSKKWFENEPTAFDVLYCFNVIHIAPWEVTGAIFKGAAKYLAKDAQLIFYGPFKIDGKQTSDSNAQFEVWLKGKDKSFGIRDITEIKEVAALHGFKQIESREMPANNFLQIFKLN